jgi:hypothetical protein
MVSSSSPMEIPRVLLNAKSLPSKISSEFHDSSRILATSLRKSAAEPEDVLIPPTVSGTEITSPNLLNGVLRASSVTISVSGQTFSIPSPDSCIFASSIAIASNYLEIFRLSSVKFPSIQQLEELFKSVRTFFAPEAFESAALDFVQNFNWSEDILSRDRDFLRSFGSLDRVLEHFSAQHPATGMNEEHIRQWLSAEYLLRLLLTVVNDGGKVDTDADFTPLHHS